jgi:hypothetical protein
MIIKVDHVIRQLDSYLSGKNEEGKQQIYFAITISSHLLLRVLLAGTTLAG